jgi:histidinol-phosphatase
VCTDHDCRVDLAADLALAHRIVDATGPVALAHFRRGVDATLKADGSPVTIADHEVEAIVLAILADERPGDAVLSEEAGASGSSTRRWIVDPIDGTSRFAAGTPGWSTLLALEVDGVVALGLIDRPASGTRYWATKGQGAFVIQVGPTLERSLARRLSVSSHADLATARFSVVPDRETEALAALRSACRPIALSPDFIVDIVEGRLDVLLCQWGDIWDHAPQVIIVEEAGGTFCDPAGGRRLDLRGGVYTNAALAAHVRTVLGLPGVSDLGA